MNLMREILPYGKFGRSRAINAENPTGEKGKGGTAASNLGIGRKGSPCLTDILARKYYAFGRYSGVRCDKSYLDYSG